VRVRHWVLRCRRAAHAGAYRLETCRPDQSRRWHSCLQCQSGMIRTGRRGRLEMAYVVVRTERREVSERNANQV
jgi:hypothetical protein